MNKITIILFIVPLFFSECKFYSFTGSSIPPEIRTIEVDYFQNNASNGPASTSQIFTERLKNKLLSDTDLKLVARDGDIVFKGFIATYEIRAKAPVEGETTAINQLNISVNVEYQNRQFPEDNYTRSFRAFTEIASGIDIVSVQDDLIQELSDQLSDDIFTATFVKW